MTVLERFQSFISHEPTSGCHLWVGASTQGRRHRTGSFWLNGRAERAPRVALILVGRTPPTSAHVAAHSCDNPWCVNPQHLRWATHKGNMRDTRQRDRAFKAHGARNGRAKLTEAQVHAMRAAAEVFGATAYELAALYGVTSSAVRRVLRRKSWRAE